jgi:hypothetical protein
MSRWASSSFSFPDQNGKRRRRRRRRRRKEGRKEEREKLEDR